MLVGKSKEIVHQTELQVDSWNISYKSVKCSDCLLSSSNKPVICGDQKLKRCDKSVIGYNAKVTCGENVLIQ